ncbi:unnamed protein product, partial [Heterosigma akashiwo]
MELALAGMDLGRTYSENVDQRLVASCSFGIYLGAADCVEGNSPSHLSTLVMGSGYGGQQANSVSLHILGPNLGDQDGDSNNELDLIQVGSSPHNGAVTSVKIVHYSGAVPLVLTGGLSGQVGAAPLYSSADGPTLGQGVAVGSLKGE